MDRILIQTEVSMEYFRVGSKLLGYGYMRHWGDVLTDTQWQDADDLPYWTHYQVYLLGFVLAIKIPAKLANLPKRIRRARQASSSRAGTSRGEGE